MNRKFLLAILALLLLVFLFQLRMPRHFVWQPTYSHTDAQPFGCMVFDSVLAATMPQGYSVTRQSMWQMQHDSVFMAQPHGIVILLGDNYLGEAVLDQLFKIVESGNVVLVATSSYELNDTLGIGRMFLGDFHLTGSDMNRLRRGRLWWLDTQQGYARDSALTVYTQLVHRAFYTITDEETDSDQKATLAHTPLAAYEESEGDRLRYIAASFPIGKGELIFLSAPLFMTNYGMLDADIRVVIGRLMNRMRHLPVVRTEAYVKSTAQTEQSPFYVLLQRQPLRWALYLTVLTILLLMGFTARRRQRVIPVIEPPKNGNLEFVRLIGTLNSLEGDHRGLVKKKLAYAAEQIRTSTGLDILDADAQRETISQLARIAGMPADELRVLLKNVHEATSGRHVVDANEMKSLIDRLNTILSSLNSP